MEDCQGSMNPNKPMNYSVVILVEKKYSDTVEYLDGLYELFHNRQDDFEFIVIANGTGRFVNSQIGNSKIEQGYLKILQFNRKNPQAVCLKAALKESSGDIIVATDGYQQITRESFIKLLDALTDDTDMVCSWRQKRVDPAANRIQSRIFNSIVHSIAGSKVHDLSSSVKVFRRGVLEKTDVYANMYRYLPVLAARRGFVVREVKCDHQEKRGRTGYHGLPSYFAALVDMLTLCFNANFITKPLRFFSIIGAGLSLIGFVMISIVFLQRIIWGIPLGGRLSLLLSIVFIVMGIQAASVGLLGEIIAFTQGRHRKEYLVEKEI